MNSADVIAIDKTDSPDEILMAAAEGRIDVYWFNGAQLETKLLNAGEQLERTSAFHRFLRVSPYDIGRLIAAGGSLEINAFEPTEEDEQAMVAAGLDDGMRFIEKTVLVERQLLFVERATLAKLQTPDELAGKQVEDPADRRRRIAERHAVLKAS